jgi:hypothetical protein
VPLRLIGEERQERYTFLRKGKVDARGFQFLDNRFQDSQSPLTTMTGAK